jgi:hypothetical protein
MLLYNRLFSFLLPTSYKTVPFADLLGAAYGIATSALHASNDIHISFGTFPPSIRDHVVYIFQQLSSQSAALENLDICFCLHAFRFVFSFYLLHFPKVSSFYLQICNLSYFQSLPVHLPALLCFSVFLFTNTNSAYTNPSLTSSQLHFMHFVVLYF